MNGTHESKDIGEKYLDFAQAAYGVKTLPRTGWVRNGISGTDVEHVGDHMWGMGLMSMLLLGDSKDVNAYHVTQLCMVHDLAESIVGDITPHCGVSKDEKARLEKEAMDKLAAKLPEKIGKRLVSLFEEFEDKKTPEAIIAHDMDKLDMVLQASFYEKKQPGRNLSDFFKATEYLSLNDSSLSADRQRLASVADAIACHRSNSANDGKSN